MSLNDWLDCYMCFLTNTVLLEWVNACVVLLWKGKGERHECSNYRNISLLNEVG